MKGIILLPSFNRAEEVAAFFKAYKETESTAPGWVIVDHDDPKKQQYRSLEYPPGWTLKLIPPRSMGEKITFLWDDYKGLDWVMILNDDHRPRTKEWDQKVLAALNGTNIVSTNDGPAPDKPWNAGRRLCGAICFSGKIIRTLGYLYPPGLKHFFSDDVWGHIANKALCGLVLGDVCVEHEHAYLHPNKRDQTFFDINGKDIFEELPKTGQGRSGFWVSDREAIIKWFQERGEQDAQKVLDIQPKQGIMIATLSHNGDVCFDYALGLADIACFFTQQGVYFEIAKLENSSLIPHARNTLVDMFLKSRCQKLLFIDSDQGFGRDSVLHLFNSNKRIIGGFTPHKRFPINLNFEPLPQHNHYFQSLTNKNEFELLKFKEKEADEKGEIEVNRSGTGFLMIDRSVFEVMKDHVEKYSAFDDRKDVKHYEFFKMGPLQGGYRGEDWWFCEKAKECKIPIFINSNVGVSHKGTFKFIPDMQGAQMRLDEERSKSA